MFFFTLFPDKTYNFSINQEQVSFAKVESDLHLRPERGRRKHCSTTKWTKSSPYLDAESDQQTDKRLTNKQWKRGWSVDSAKKVDLAIKNLISRSCRFRRISQLRKKFSFGQN